MQGVIWSGTALTLLGVVGLVACMGLALRIKRSGADDAAMKAALQRIVALNLGSLALSGLGLMAVVTGIFLA